MLLPILFGVLIGLLLGAIGGGGSILTVPILVFVMGQEPHAATATSLAIVGGTSLVGAIPHWRAGNVAIGTAIPFGLAGIAGSFVGAWLNHLVSGNLILVLFGLLMIVVAARMLFAPTAGDGGRTGPRDARHWLRVVGAGLGVGLMTGFFGVGGGFLIVPALVLVLGFTMRAAVGTSLIVIAINSASGLIAHLQYGGLDLGVALLFMAGGVIGALLGARLAGRLHEQRLQRGFASLVAVVGVWLIVANLPLGLLTR